VFLKDFNLGSPHLLESFLSLEQWSGIQIYLSDESKNLK